MYYIVDKYINNKSKYFNIYKSIIIFAFDIKFMKRYIFLLGGWDLEMITIRKILQKRGYMYYDNPKHLKYFPSHVQTVLVYLHLPTTS